MPARKGGHDVFCGNWENGVDKRCDERYNLSCVCGRSSSGRARPCQGRGSEFEPRRPLQKETPSDRMVFLFGMPRAGWNSLPRPARSASNPEVKAGLPRMALPFVGCREASSSLVDFAAQSAKNKEKPPFGRFQTVEKACHCEPVRTLAWQSVSKTHNSCTFPQIPS